MKRILDREEGRLREAAGKAERAWEKALERAQAAEEKRESAYLRMEEANQLLDIFLRNKGTRN